MGTGNQKIQTTIQTDKEFIKQIIDDRYGEIKIFRDLQTNNLNSMITKTINSKEIWAKIIQKTLKRIKIKSPHIVKLLKWNEDNQQDFCANFYKVHIIYEFYSRSLKQQISQRVKIIKFFTEDEVIYLFYCILSGLFAYKNHNIFHKDISPNTVFIDENGCFKINDIHFMNNGFTAYKRFLMGNSDKCYLAPELIEDLKHRAMKPTVDWEKYIVFSIGLTVLEAASLESVQKIYDLEDYNVFYLLFILLF